jgi:2-amino-4-hydroxy-6-hydroxymethyldihydropteridine diphosphokinase
VTLAYLGLGSNVGDRSAHLAAARRLLAERGVMLKRGTSVEETEPFGVPDQRPFLNQVLEVEWSGGARDLLRVAKEVEAAVGRRPTYRWGPREIDVDILAFDDERLEEPELVLPHPGIRERAFVQEQLRELRPELVAAILGDYR